MMYLYSSPLIYVRACTNLVASTCVHAAVRLTEDEEAMRNYGMTLPWMFVI